MHPPKKVDPSRANRGTRRPTAHRKPSARPSPPAEPKRTWKDCPDCQHTVFSDEEHICRVSPAEPKCEHRRTVENPSSGMPDCLDCGGKEIDYQPDSPCDECGHEKASFISRYIGWLCSKCEVAVAALPTFKEGLNQIRRPAESEGKLNIDNVCPITKALCEDEACPPGAICNLSGSQAQEHL